MNIPGKSAVRFVLIVSVFSPLMSCQLLWGTFVSGSDTRYSGVIDRREKEIRFSLKGGRHEDGFHGSFSKVADHFQVVATVTNASKQSVYFKPRKYNAADFNAEYQANYVEVKPNESAVVYKGPLNFLGNGSLEIGSGRTLVLNLKLDKPPSEPIPFSIWASFGTSP